MSEKKEVEQEPQEPQKPQIVDGNLELNKLLLSFYSSQLNNHGRMVIGFAALIFTVTQVASSVSEPISCAQYWVIVTGMFFASLAFWFVLMRLLVYGVLASYAQHVELESFQTMNKQVEVACGKNENILWKVPVSWFATSEEHNRRRRFYGIFFCCALPSAVITFLMVVVLNLW
jgi:hypothetical protein